MPPEGNVYIKKAADLGIPYSALSTTSQVINTDEESQAIRKSFKKDFPQPRILLVTSAFHMKRAKRQFERNGFIVEPFPVDFKAQSYSEYSNWKDPLEWIPNSRNLNSSSIALREMLGRLFYRSWEK